MNLPQIVSQDEWHAARQAPLAKEKKATRALDALAAERRRLPMVGIDKEHVFEGPDGKATLRDLFNGRSRLVVCLGRQEDWEDSPRGWPQTPPYVWSGLHDECDATAHGSGA